MMLLSRSLLLLTVLLLSACTKEPLYQEESFVFGTRVEVSVYGEDETRAKAAVALVMQEFQRLHNMLHAAKPSELSELNTAIAKGKASTISSELATMLRDATQLSMQSDGLFNPAIGGLIKLWGFHADEYQAALPDAKLLAALVAKLPQMNDLGVSSSANPNPSPTLPLTVEGAVRSSPPLSEAGSHVVRGPNSVLLAGARGGREGLGFAVSSRNRAVQLDLGGYAKGYALDRAAALLKQQGIHHALINIGGNVLALGSHGSRPWRVGIQHPRKPGPLATLELHDGEAIGTSGDYQRYFELDGKRYCHLIDPRNGQPVQGVQAVTILTSGKHAGVLSDAASKPLFIAGANNWQDYAQKMQLKLAMLIDSDGTVHLTPTMQKRLEFTEKNVKLTSTQ